MYQLLELIAPTIDLGNLVVHTDYYTDATGLSNLANFFRIYSYDSLDLGGNGQGDCCLTSNFRFGS